MGVKLQSSTKSFNVSSEIRPPFPIISSLVNSHLKNYARKIPPTKRKTDLNGPNEKVKKWTELRTTNNNDNKQKCPALSHFLPTVQCNTIQLYWQVSVQLRQDCFMVPNTHSAQDGHLDFHTAPELWWLSDRICLLFLKMADTQKLPKVPETFLRRIVIGGPRQKQIFAIINRQL